MCIKYKPVTYYFLSVFRFFRRRYTPNAELFNSFVKKAKKQKTSKWNLGGNAAVMATRFKKEGADVLLAATMSKKLRSHLIDGLQLTESLSKYEEDDIHLIMEYRTGDVFGDLTAPRANRYILHNDKNNPMLKSLELLNMDEFKPNLFVVSGLQMMDNFPFSDSQIRTQRLIKVKEQMTEVPPATLIHFEMASFVEIELLNDLLKNVIPFTNSIGMNEQELDNILEVLEEGRISMSAESNPRVSTTLDQMRKVFRILNKNYLVDQKSQNGRQITRLHVHTLAFQLFMVERKSEWRHTKSAAAKSSLIAHKHVCAADEVNPTNAYLILDKSFSTSATDNDDYEEMKNRPKRIHISERDAVPCWNETIKITNDHKLDVEICISPVLVCRDAKQTAGAGDNISAGGLVVQI